MINSILNKKNFLISVVSTIILFLSFNFIINKINFNFGIDFTETNTFTLSKGTKNLLKNLEEPLTLEFIYSRQLSKNIPVIQNYANQIDGLLNRYEELAKGKIIFNIIEPEAYSDEEDYVNRYNIQGFPLGQEGTNLYFGLIASNTTDDIEVIKFFDPSKAGSLEKQLTDIVYKLSRVEKPKVGFLSWVDTSVPPNSQPDRNEYIILDRFKDYYDFETLDQKTTNFDKLDVLIVYHPSDVSEKTEYAIEQFILNGGNTVIFVDPYFEKNDHMNKSSDLPKVFQTLNLNYNDNVILDGAQATLQTMLKLNWPEVRGNFINQSETVGSGLSLVRLVSPGGFAPLNEDSQVVYSPLISSSELTMDLPLKDVLDPIKLINNFKPSGIPYDFGVKLNGTAKTSFSDYQEKFENHIDQSSQDINVIVFSDADFIRTAFWARVQRFLDSTVIEESSDNGSLVSNILDSMTGFNDFIDLRNKETPFRPFTVVQKLQAEAEQQYLGQEQELQARLDATLNQIKNLSGGGNTNDVQLSDQQLEELADFQADLESTRKQLREVRRQLNKDIDDLANRINILNTFLLPILLIVLMFIVPRQLGIRKRQSRS
ncbi:MAG: Gldg family protein [Pelagibacteraceae bacterium]